MITIDGRQLAQEKLDNLKTQIAQIKGRAPSLAVVLVGDDQPSHLYVNLKQKAAKKVGVEFHKYLLSADAPQAEVIECIEFLRKDDDVDGVIVQLPLPAQIDADKCVAAIGVDKDVDGFHAQNVERFLAGETDGVFPIFPKAMILLALAAVGEVDGVAEEISQGKRKSLLADKKAILITHSQLFAQIMSEAGRRIGLQMSVVWQDKLKCSQAQVLSADVVFTACGEVGLVTGNFIKSGAIVIDGGIVKVGDKVQGDVDLESVSEKAAAVTLVPGGVGPMTVACLLSQTVSFVQNK